tara:strand:- start:247 stop:990 length:744 start_codon:yes stop_codon:yes gene_type:complete
MSRKSKFGTYTQPADSNSQWIDTHQDLSKLGTEQLPIGTIIHSNNRYIMNNVPMDVWKEWKVWFINKKKADTYTYPNINWISVDTDLSKLSTEQLSMGTIIHPTGKYIMLVSNEQWKEWVNWYNYQDNVIKQRLQQMLENIQNTIKSRQKTIKELQIQFEQKEIERATYLFKEQEQIKKKQLKERQKVRQKQLKQQQQLQKEQEKEQKKEQSIKERKERVDNRKFKYIIEHFLDEPISRKPRKPRKK